MTTYSEPASYDDGSIGLEGNGAGDKAAAPKVVMSLSSGCVDATPWNRQGAWFAVVAVMAIAWFPYMASCLLHWGFGDDSTAWPYIANTLWEIVTHVAIVAVVFYLMYCDGRPWSTFGIRRPHWLRVWLAALLILTGTAAILGALYLLSASLVGTEAVERFSESAYQFARPMTAADLLALVLLSLSVGLSEELVMRGYLIPTFERLLRSTWLSILLTSTLFASYHIYQGLGPMLWIFGVGLVFGAIFCRWRNLWPLVLAHAAMDVIAIAVEN